MVPRPNRDRTKAKISTTAEVTTACGRPRLPPLPAGVAQKAATESIDAARGGTKEDQIDACIPNALNCQI